MEKQMRVITPVLIAPGALPGPSSQMTSVVSNLKKDLTFSLSERCICKLKDFSLVKADEKFIKENL